MNIRDYSWWPLVVFFFLAAAASAQETKPPLRPRSENTTPDTVDKDYSAELPRIEPLSPEDALKSFEIVPGFKLEQVATEPLVSDPIAICFDENSRMYVVEMRGYSENRDEKLSRIKLLEDTDNDGKYDKATVYADGLLWPTAIQCWKGGVFIADAPDLLYFKDTNNDGIADGKKVVATGFGTSNVQGLVNTFQWSLDNRITMAVSSSGAVLTRPNYNTKPLTIRGRDLAFEPETLELTPITGGAQHGATTDMWGNRFVCSNSDHIQHCVFEDRHLGRNSYLAVSNARRSIATDGPQADVFRISPLEPWRIVRTRLRVNKIVPGIVEGGGRPSGYFTSATGVTIYNGDAWPEEFRGLAFVGDVGSNIVHRKRLKPNGVTFTAERIDEKREFLASRDTWFRPVQFANAPDGCLYICDMYRETIEHPLSIPPVLKKHLDLTSGRDRGRIYRVVHEQTKVRNDLPHLSNAKSEELVPLLNHPNGWHRETAARLLYERQDRGAADDIERQLTTKVRPEGFIQSLYTLYGLQKLSTETLALGLQHENPHVREQAVRVGDLQWSRNHVQRIALQTKFIKLAEDPDLRVRFQVALALVGFPPEVRNPALAIILRKDIGNADIRAAVQSAVPVDASSLLAEIAQDEKLLAQPGSAEFIRSLATQIGKQRLETDLATIGPILERWSEKKSPLLAVALQSLAARQDSPQAEQLAKATGGKSASLLQSLLQRAEATALADDQKLNARTAAVEQLRMARWSSIPPVVEKLLTPAQPVELQSAVIALVGNFDSPEVAPLLLARFEQFTPTLKARALDVLVSRPAWALQLLEAVEEKKIPAADIDQTRWKLLGDSANSDLRTRALKLAFANPPAERIVVLDAYRSTLEATGDAARGKEVFKKNCAACHKLQGFGHELGPNLAAMKNRGPEAILVNVLDPNREVNPQFLNYLLLTTDGRSLSGMLIGETATSVTLRKQDSVTDTVLRVDIESLKSTGQSLMPVGMEKQVDKAAMADLLQYLKTVE